MARFGLNRQKTFSPGARRSCAYLRRDLKLVKDGRGQTRLHSYYVVMPERERAHIIHSGKKPRRKDEPPKVSAELALELRGLSVALEARFRLEHRLVRGVLTKRAVQRRRPEHLIEIAREPEVLIGGCRRDRHLRLANQALDFRRRA